MAASEKTNFRFYTSKKTALFQTTFFKFKKHLSYACFLNYYIKAFKTTFCSC